MTRKCHVRFGGGPGEKGHSHLARGLSYVHTVTLPCEGRTAQCTHP
jgi:hypothetical protein